VAAAFESAGRSRSRMSAALNAGPRSYTVAVNGQPCRVWDKGDGRPLVFLAGFGGLPRWTECLERLAARRRVIAPSLPGFPGTAAIGPLYTQLDWLLATHDLIAGAGLARCDLMGVSLGAALAADVAAIWPNLVDRLVLVSALGLFDENEPSADPFAQRKGTLPQLLCADPERYVAHTAVAEHADPVEWAVITTRAQEVREELARSKEEMEQRLGERVGWMAYPFGKPRLHLTKETQDLAAEAGYEGAAAVLFRAVRAADSPLAIPRFFVCRETLETLKAKVGGAWDFLGWWQERVPVPVARVISPRDFIH